MVIPPSLNHRMPAPVLFVFHGAIDTTRQAADYTQLDRLAFSPFAAEQAAHGEFSIS